MAETSDTGIQSDPNPALRSLKQTGSGLCIILFPIMRLIGFTPIGLRDMQSTLSFGGKAR